MNTKIIILIAIALIFKINTSNANNLNNELLNNSLLLLQQEADPFEFEDGGEKSSKDQKKAQKAEQKQLKDQAKKEKKYQKYDYNKEVVTDDKVEENQSTKTNENKTTSKKEEDASSRSWRFDKEEEPLVQENNYVESNKRYNLLLNKKPSLAFNAGLLSYYGDLNNIEPVKSLTSFRFAYSASIEKRFSYWLGARIDGMLGTMSYNSYDLGSYRNFETPVKSISGELVVYLDNDMLLNLNSKFSPYISVGLGYLNYSPKSDLIDENGNSYYYWSDGFIYDVDEATNNPNLYKPKQLYRDYEYETEYLDTTDIYTGKAMIFPVRIGTKISVSPRIQVDVQLAYYFTDTDYLDNYIRPGSKANDGYVSLSGGLRYSFGVEKQKDSKKIYKNSVVTTKDDKDFSKWDSDKDGIIDDEDMCPGTPFRVKVDIKGCPLDLDYDGVPDYRDKEPNSLRDVVVNAEGVTVTYSSMKENLENSKAITRNIVYVANQLPEEGRFIPLSNDVNKVLLYQVLLEADTNKDGYLSILETQAVYESYLDGEKKYTIEQIYQIVKFFIGE